MSVSPELANLFKADPDYVDKDGSIHLELGWWRGVSGRLSIQGRRLDAPTPGALVRERPYAGTAVASITSMAASVRHGHGSGRLKARRLPVWVEGLADLPARRLCPLRVHEEFSRCACRGTGARRGRPARPP